MAHAGLFLDLNVFYNKPRHNADFMNNIPIGFTIR